MHIEKLAVEGSFLVSPTLHKDDRGLFFEGLRTDLLEDLRGETFHPVQMNISTSREGTLRGIHASTAPLGQAKYVTCVVGSIFDVIVDLHVDSPTFGQFAFASLESWMGTSVFVPPWAGHAFLATSPEAKVVYLTSSTYSRHDEITIDALDMDLAIPWPRYPDYIRSPRDRAAQPFAAYTRHLTTAHKSPSDGPGQES
jgi:NDP-hexose 3,5-(Or5-) epimerase